MKCVHWSLGNKSGLDHMAIAMSEAENRLGIESHTVLAHNEATWTEDVLTDVDVHVCHVHFPDRVRKLLNRPAKIVWIGHGTPEHTWQGSVDTGAKGGYGFGDSFMLMQHWLRAADARVTFWPRHKALYETMVPKGIPIHCIPMGVDKRFWCPGVSKGKWGGSPSVWTAENAHQGKSPLDLFLLWPWIAQELDEVVLHACNVPLDMHRWVFPLVNANGTAFRAHLSGIRWGHDDLQNAFRSIDFFIGLVRYGDFNGLSLQAAAVGVPTISYKGNPFATYWLPEGDQRDIATELLAILKGETAPRADKEPVPDIMETARAMEFVYQGIA